MDRDLVPEENRSFYINWVRRFLNSEFSTNELSENDKVMCFSDQLSRDSSVKDWQLRQAMQAVSLYLDVYLKDGGGNVEYRSRNIESRSMADGQDAHTTEGLAEDALREMKKLLRLRHYAYRTEQTYEEWVERYLKYVKNG